MTTLATMDPESNINILLRIFSGLSLPDTVSFSLSPSTPTSALLDHIITLLPESLSTQLILTTTSNRTIFPSQTPISTLLTTPTTTTSRTHHATALLPLHLSTPLPGGKGGFGSQLRAAGGRMSSRKRKNALASDPNNGVGSNRNLDGRRLRTITEAKNLAAYLAGKPEMERREKEERRKRWEAVVEGAERREEEFRKAAVGGRGKGLSEEWLEEREDAGERTREAVRKAMASGGGWRDSVAGVVNGEGNASASTSGSGSGSAAGLSRDPSEAGSDQDDDDEMSLDENEVKTLEKEAAEGDVDAIWVLRNRIKKPPMATKGQQRTYFGFDEDDEFMSSSEDEAEDLSTTKGKKGKEKLSG